MSSTGVHRTTTGQRVSETCPRAAEVGKGALHPGGQEPRSRPAQQENAPRSRPTGQDPEQKTQS